MSSVNNESNLPASSIKFVVDSAISCFWFAKLRFELNRNNTTKIVNRSKIGEIITINKFVIEEVIRRNISLSIPSPLKGRVLTSANCIS